MSSKYEEAFASLIALAHVPPPVRQYAFAKPLREYKADFAWPDAGLLVEVDGGAFIGRGGLGAVISRTTAVGYHQSVQDYRKRNLANLLGFTYLSYQPRQFTEGITEIMLWLRWHPSISDRILVGRLGVPPVMLEEHVARLAADDKTHREIALRKTSARKARQRFLR